MTRSRRLRATGWQAASTASLSWQFDSDYFPMTIHKPMTFQEAKSIARHLGLTLRLLRSRSARGIMTTTHSSGSNEQMFGAE